jgi:hypothetical protein
LMAPTSPPSLSLPATSNRSRPFGWKASSLNTDTRVDRNGKQ